MPANNKRLKTINVSGNLGITTAATWDERALWTVPAGYSYQLSLARCGVTTAATRTLIAVGKKLATFDPNTNTFTSLVTTSAPDWYDRLFYRVVTTHSAVATTVTATYIDQDGSLGNSTSGLVIPSAAPAGDWFEFVLAAGDFGIQAVTNATDTGTPASVTDEIWGLRTLVEDLGPANAPHIALVNPDTVVEAGESIVILFNAAATTAQIRHAGVVGNLSVS